jgi:hypothetical protein
MYADVRGIGKGFFQTAKNDALKKQKIMTPSPLMSGAQRVLVCRELTPVQTHYQTLGGWEHFESKVDLLCAAAYPGALALPFERLPRFC